MNTLKKLEYVACPLCRSEDYINIYVGNVPFIRAIEGEMLTRGNLDKTEK